MFKQISWVGVGILIVVAAAYYGFHSYLPSSEVELQSLEVKPSDDRILGSPPKLGSDRQVSSDPQNVSDQKQLIVQDIHNLKQAMKEGDSEKLKDLVDKLKGIGLLVIEVIREDLSEISWTHMTQRRDHFHILGFLKNDQAIPIIEDEIRKEDQSIAVDAYKERVGVAVSDEALIEDLLHHGTDVLPDASGGLTVSYTTSKIAAIQALGMMNSAVSKAKLLKLAVSDDGQPTTQVAVQTYVAVATPVERQALLHQLPKDRLKRYLSRTDMQKYYPGIE